MAEKTPSSILQAIETIEKAKPGVKVLTLGKEDRIKMPRLSTGSLKFDQILGWGLPKGRIIEIFGAESSGKTTMCLVVAAEVTRKGGHVLFVDAEQALDLEYAKKIGCNPNNLHIVQPGYGEEAFDVVHIAATTGQFDYIIVDSVSALVPESVVKGSAEDTVQIGLLARMMSQNLQRLTAILGQQKDTTVMFINQERAKIGGFTPSFMGETTTTTGGKALPFFASIRIKTKKWEPVKRQDNRIGATVILECVKNKTTAPYKKTEVVIMFDEQLGVYGVNSTKELTDLIISTGVLGTRWSFTTLEWVKIKAWTIDVNGTEVKMSGNEMLEHYYSQPEQKKELDFLQKVVEYYLQTGEIPTLERNSEGQVISYIESLKWKDVKKDKDSKKDEIKE